jgi:hypothetical protein
MRLREFFSDQNEKEDVLTDDQKQYNFIKKSKNQIGLHLQEEANGLTYT